MRAESVRLFQNRSFLRRTKNRVYLFAVVKLELLLPTEDCGNASLDLPTPIQRHSNHARVPRLGQNRPKPTNFLVGFANLLSKSQTFPSLGRFSNLPIRSRLSTFCPPRVEFLRMP